MANRYWVGGTANWDGTAGSKWALTSGGAGGQAVPTSVDNVFFDAASGAVTCTISTGNTGADNLNCTGFTGTLAGSGNLDINGNITLVAGMTYTHTGRISISSSGTQTIRSAGKTLGSITLNGTSTTVFRLLDALTLGATRTFTLTRGELELGGFTLSTGIFSSNNSNNNRSISFGSTGSIVLTSTTAGTTVLDMPDVAGFTRTTGGSSNSFVRNQAATATVVFGTTGGSGTNAIRLTVNAGASALTITSGSWFGPIDFTGSTSTVTGTGVIIGTNQGASLTLDSGGTYTSFAPLLVRSGTLTSAGKTLSQLTVSAASTDTIICADALTITNALTFTNGTLKLKDGVTSTVGSLVTTGTTLKYLESTTAGTQATISDASGTNTVTYLSIKDSNATGGATFVATDPTNVNAGNNTGWSIVPQLSLGNMFMMF